MPKTATVDVPGGYKIHGGVATRIVVREPTVEDYLDIGEIYSFVPAPDGMAYPVENREAVKSYVERLIIEPTDPLLIAGLPLSIGRDLRTAVIGFFQRPAAAGAPSTTSGETSSGDAKDASPQSTSNE